MPYADGPAKPGTYDTSYRKVLGNFPHNQQALHAPDVCRECDKCWKKLRTYHESSHRGWSVTEARATRA